jgi:hypothetical protein
MRVVFFDCFAGISGDMIVGALLDLGVDLEALRRQLGSLKLEGYEVSSRRLNRSGISAAKFDVAVKGQAQPERSFADIRSMIQQSDLSELTKHRSISVFGSLAKAEARVHGTTPDQVHFHEVGAVDSIVDIVGAMIGFDTLRVDRFFCSPLRVGSGTIDTEDGRMPVPAPATLELLKGVPIYGGDLEGEFVTPTGAAIVKTLCSEFGAMPRMYADGVGYGAGSRDPRGFPNALRIVIGDLQEVEENVVPAAWGLDESVTVVETNIDDMGPQVFGYVMERAFALGALDVFMVPAQMKKDRPGVLLTVLCKREALDSIIQLLLVETTTLGVRYYEASRRVLERAIETIETEYGHVRLKVARDGPRTLHFQPEYEDCVRLAAETGAPLLEVQAAASAAYRERLKDKADGKLQTKERSR